MQRSIYIFLISLSATIASTITHAAEYAYESYDTDYSNNQAYYNDNEQNYEDRSYNRSNGYRYRQSSYDDDYYYHQPRQQRYYRQQAQESYRPSRRSYSSGNYASRLPSHISAGEKVILVDPNVHAWGAYSADGNLVKAGIVTAGSNWCPDIGRPCRTKAGSFRIFSLGSSSCKSSRYPVGKGGAPMPYCMYFNKNQALHGSHEVAEANLSHGCLRMQVGDAEWLRFNFAKVGTKVIVKPY